MKKILWLVLLAVLIPCIIVCASVNDIKIYNSEAESFGSKISLSSQPFYYHTDKDYLYTPADDILPLCEAVLGWDSAENALICIKDNKKFLLYTNQNEAKLNDQMLWFNTPSCILKDNVLFVSDAVVEYMTGKELIAKGDFSEYGQVSVFANQTKFYVNGKEYTLPQEPYIYSSKLFLPLDETLARCGMTLGWDDGLKAVVCVKDGVTSYVFPERNNIWVGETEHIFDEKPIMISDITYISEEMINKLTGFDIFSYGDIKQYKKRADLSNTKRTDAYRLKGGIVSGGGITVIGNFGMELVSVSPQNGKNYASVINAVANTLDGFNVYNILVPTAAEFYAPLSMYPNQLAGIKTAYENLSSKVTPINVYDTLAEHAGEKIYFGTDHHWTQRGAYYAYKEFIEFKGKKIDPLETFKNVPSYSHVGSLAGFAKGTAAGNIMRNSPELLERFIPKFATVGTVYADQNRQSSQGVVKGVNTSANNYQAFIGGDNPITVFYTDAPSDESIVIIKESFGNAFATWALHNYKTVCVIDPRKFNGFAGYNRSFNLRKFCTDMNIDDVVFINYPVAASSVGIRTSILKMA